VVSDLGDVINYVDVIIDRLILVVLPRLSSRVITSSSVVGSGLSLSLLLSSKA